jgi:formamidopyrimidine-DNA glycosylase
MTGRLGIFPVGSPVAGHDHVRWRLDHDLELRLYDPRRFGSVHVRAADEAMEIDKTFFRTTGPEPFSEECSVEHLYTKARQRKQPIKTFLMDMKIIAGIGNIYANESLFSAGINPSRPAAGLSRCEWKRLLSELRRILNHAIACGGSTISDYLNASGERGLFQVHFKVYGKKGEPCPQCGALIEKTQLGGRASYFCPDCQKK